MTSLFDTFLPRCISNEPNRIRSVVELEIYDTTATDDIVLPGMHAFGLELAHGFNHYFPAGMSIKELVLLANTDLSDLLNEVFSKQGLGLTTFSSGNDLGNFFFERLKQGFASGIMVRVNEMHTIMETLKATSASFCKIPLPLVSITV